MKVIKAGKSHTDEVANAIKSGGILVYPTDTVYGLGCNAENRKSVERISAAKKRDPSIPFSVIAPSLEWIYENSRIKKDDFRFLCNLFPGPYTAIVRTKLPKTIAPGGTIGVRIPRNGFCDFIRKQGVPFVTTSVNISGNDPVASIKDIPAEIAEIAEIAVDSGELHGSPSRVFNLTGKEMEISRW